MWAEAQLKGPVLAGDSKTCCRPADKADMHPLRDFRPSLAFEIGKMIRIRQFECVNQSTWQSGECLSHALSPGIPAVSEFESVRMCQSMRFFGRDGEAERQDLTRSSVSSRDIQSSVED